MKIKNVLFILLIFLMTTAVNAQMKIGYVNIELVLIYMPETQAMNQQLQTFHQYLFF